MAKHGQRAANLPDRAIQLRQIMGFRRIAEEAIQRLLDLSQIILNLTPDLANQEFFLERAASFHRAAESRHHRPQVCPLCRRTKRATIRSTCWGKIGSQALETLLSVL